MINDSIQDSTRYIVSDIHHGSIMPGKREEMLRDVFLLSNADIRGGIYSHELLVEGSNISVQKSIFAAKSIIFRDSRDSNDNRINQFCSTVVATDSILSENKQGKIRFKSDIYCNKLNISNAIIYGNIFVNNAVINNCIVLGGIFCNDNLNISNSIYSTFKAKRVSLGENLYQLYPVALCQTPISLKHPIKAITFFNIDGSDVSANSGIISLDEDDVFEVNENYFYPNDNTLDESQNNSNKIYCISIAERILNTEKIINNFMYNKIFIEALALEPHLSHRENFDKSKKSLEQLENNLWGLLQNSRNIVEVDGTEGIDYLIKRIKDRMIYLNSQK